MSGNKYSLSLRTGNRFAQITLVVTAFVAAAALAFMLLRPMAESFYQGFESGSRTTEANNCWVFQSFDVREGESNITGRYAARSGQLTGTSNYLTTPIVMMSEGTGTLTFKHNVNTLSGSTSKNLQVILIDFATGVQDTVWTFTYSNTSVQNTSITINHSGAFKIQWRAWGVGGSGRVWLDNITVPAQMIDSPGNCGSPTSLPVVLTGFQAEMEGLVAIVSWSTSEELNSSHFEIERSEDGSQFENIGKVNSKGNSNQVQDYAFTDTKAGAISGKIYYRLRMVDVDGTFSYAPLVELVNDANIHAWKLVNAYPNPTSGVFTLEVFSPDIQPVVLELYNIQGIRLLQKTFSVSPGVNNQKLDLSPYAPGIYLYKLIQGEQVITGKVRKQ